MSLQWNKSCVFSRDGVMPPGCPIGVELAGKIIEGKFEPGFDCYGVPMESPKYISSELRDISTDILSDTVKLDKF